MGLEDEKTQNYAMGLAFSRRALWRRCKLLIGILLVVFVMTAKMRRDNRLAAVGMFYGLTIQDSSTDTPTSRSPAKVKQRVAMVTATDYRWVWQGALEAFKLSVQERQKYAALHGYSFDVVDLRGFKEDTIGTSWPVVWQKIPVLRHMFEKYPDADWVWWLDADAIVMGNQDLDTYLFDRLESLQAEARQIHSEHQVEEHGMAMFKYTKNISLAETNLIVTPDMDLMMINAGSFLIRRREVWTDMLLDIWADPLFLKAANASRIGLQEQGVLAHLIVSHATVARHTAIVPMTTINAFPSAGPWTWRNGSLVMHGAGCYVRAECAHWMREYRAIKNGLKEHAEQNNWIRDIAFVNRD